jgi:hypothetical protein
VRTLPPTAPAAYPPGRNPEGSPSQAYGARLESVLGVTSLGGSNPPPSATGTPSDLQERPGRDGRDVLVEGP